MEEKINIAEILKDKPRGTKLYSILSDGECFLNEASEDSIYIDIDNRKRFWCFTVYGSTHSFPNGCVLLFPSREMRDWEKFSWKKGDVLISDCGFVCIFKEWASDDYTKFNGCYFDGMPNAETAKYSKLDNNTAYGYIREIENRCGGKLNLETLEMEKHQPFGWVKSKEDESRALITLIISERDIFINSIGGLTMYELMEKFTFADGAVFGILEEE